MLAYQRSDVTAFEVLYGRYKNALFAFISRSCPRGVAEEIAQDTWAAIIDSAQRYTDSATFKTYLYHIAHNKIVDHWRRQKPDQNDETVDTIDAIVDENNVTPEKEIVYSQINSAIRQLPGEQRDTFLLQQQGFSQSEIAEITGSGKETVKSRLRYATNTLRQQFEIGL